MSAKLRKKKELYTVKETLHILFSSEYSIVGDSSHSGSSCEDNSSNCSSQ